MRSPRSATCRSRRSLPSSSSMTASSRPSAPISVVLRLLALPGRVPGLPFSPGGPVAKCCASDLSLAVRLRKGCLRLPLMLGVVPRLVAGADDEKAACDEACSGAKKNSYTAMKPTIGRCVPLRSKIRARRILSAERTKRSGRRVRRGIKFYHISLWHLVTGSTHQGWIEMSQSVTR